MGSALPPVAFITWPVNMPSRLVLPARYSPLWPAAQPAPGRRCAASCASLKVWSSPSRLTIAVGAAAAGQHLGKDGLGRGRGDHPLIDQLDQCSQVRCRQMAIRARLATFEFANHLVVHPVGKALGSTSSISAASKKSAISMLPVNTSACSAVKPQHVDVAVMARCQFRILRAQAHPFVGNRTRCECLAPSFDLLLAWLPRLGRRFRLQCSE